MMKLNDTDDALNKFADLLGELILKYGSDLLDEIEECEREKENK